MVLDYLEDLAIILEETGKVKESESLLRRLLVSRKRATKAPEEEGIWRAMSNLAGLLERSGRSEEALKLHQQLQA